ncbi:hypothetical protein [Streptomyces fragilis]|uniref:Uncharacterized protein n=1 Tax=Streptomyces fragilis TaxID=67301 RepID=A0ABV2YR82_9ACTN|nr:hypothetical protein [Streptomyces fragilis]
MRFLLRVTAMTAVTVTVATAVTSKAPVTTGDGRDVGDAGRG